MPEDEPRAPVGDVREALGQPTPSEILVAARLLETDEPRSTTGEIAGDVGLSVTATRQVLKDLEERGLASSRKIHESGRGRNPIGYAATGELKSAVGAAAEPDLGDAREDVVCALADAHYLRGLSSLPCSRIALEIPGASSKRVSADLQRLEDSGAVEKCNPGTGSKTQWRLRDVTDVAPYRV